MFWPCFSALPYFFLGLCCYNTILEPYYAIWCFVSTCRSVLDHDTEQQIACIVCVCQKMSVTLSKSVKSMYCNILQTTDWILPNYSANMLLVNCWIAEEELKISLLMPFCVTSTTQFVWYAKYAAALYNYQKCKTYWFHHCHKMPALAW